MLYKKDIVNCNFYNNISEQLSNKPTGY